MNGVVSPEVNIRSKLLASSGHFRSASSLNQKTIPGGAAADWMKDNKQGGAGREETEQGGKWRHRYSVPAGVSMHECGLRIAGPSVCFSGEVRHSDFS